MGGVRKINSETGSGSKN